MRTDGQPRSAKKLWGINSQEWCGELLDGQTDCICVNRKAHRGPHICNHGHTHYRNHQLGVLESAL